MVVNAGHADGALAEPEAPPQAIGNGPGLLVDFLEHEVLVAAFLNGLQRHFQLRDHRGHLVVPDGADFQAFGQ